MTAVALALGVTGLALALTTLVETLDENVFFLCAAANNAKGNGNSTTLEANPPPRGPNYFHGSALPLLLVRLKLGRHRDLEDFPVIRILEHLVPDTWRLVPGVAGLDADLPDVLKVELRPALDQVDHLEFELVRMVAHRPCAGLIGPNDVRQRLALSGSLDA